MTDSNPTVDFIKAMYAAAADEPACPYCNADDELVEPEPNVLVMEIRHDDDCPELAGRRTDHA